MTTLRKAYTPPSYTLYENEKDLGILVNEIKKFKPEIEVTLENSTERAIGSIQQWQTARKLFTVHWEQKSEGFDKKIESNSTLRAYFKAKLFSAQIIFKSHTLRRISPSLYHFRIPEQIFKQQRRSGLRVPIDSPSAKLVTKLGEFKIIDLSVTGAKVIAASNKITSAYQNIILDSCELHLGKMRIKSSNFSVRLIRISDANIGVKFQGLGPLYQMKIKQFLLEQLKLYYLKTFRPLLKGD